MAECEPISNVKPGFVLWFTGLPASGKTVLAREVHQKLSALGVHSVILDSDELRRVLTPTPLYSPEERDWFYGTIAYLAKWLSESGVNVLIAATANRRAYRDTARKQIQKFAEVFVRCPVDVCKQRDPKGLYANAASNQTETLPGAGAVFEEPFAPEIVVDTDRLTPTLAGRVILERVCSMDGFV